MNALRHGRETAQRRTWRRDALRFIRLDTLFRDVLAGEAEVTDPGALVGELFRLSDRLCQT
jgi:hypothetical protein